MGVQKISCCMCAKNFNTPEHVNSGKIFIPSMVCKDCYERLARDPHMCFGKQHPKGLPLADLSEEQCARCQDYKVCVKWPQNLVVWIPPAEEGDSEMADKNKKKEKKTPPPEAAGKKKPVAAATGKKKPAVTAKEKKPFVKFAEDLQFRDGTSIVVVMKALTAKPEITLEELCKTIEASGVKSDNVRARALKGFSYMKDRGLMGKKIEDDKIIFYKK